MPIDPTKLKVGILVKPIEPTIYLDKNTIYRVIETKDNYWVEIEDTETYQKMGVYRIEIFELVEQEQESNTMKEIYIDDIPACHELGSTEALCLFLPIDTPKEKKTMFFQRMKDIGYDKGLTSDSIVKIVEENNNEKYFVLNDHRFIWYTTTSYIDQKDELYKVIFTQNEKQEEKKQQLSKLPRQFIRLFEEEQ